MCVYVCIYTHTYICTYVQKYVRTHTHLPRYNCHLFFCISKMILLYNTLKIVHLLLKAIVCKFKHRTVALILLSIFWHSILPDHGLFQPKHVVIKFSYNIHSCYHKGMSKLKPLRCLSRAHCSCSIFSQF